MCMPSTSNNDEQHHNAVQTRDDEQGTSASPALACAECFNPVGMEGSARAVLLIPCQHLLHQSCVEYIRRSIKLLRLLRSSRRQHQHGGDDDDDDVASEDDGDDDERGCLNGLSCPACGAPVARLVPLYLPTATEEKKMKTEDDEEEQNNTHVADVLHATMHAQKKHLSRLRALFDRRRSITNLGRQCATLHHRREHLRREVDELHQLCPAPQPSSSSSSLMCASLPVDAMNATELQLYLVQTTPMLVRTQDTLRRERELAERQRRQLNLAKQRYFRAKQQHPQASSSSAKATAPREDEDDTNSSSSTAILMKKLAAHRAAISASRSRDHPLIKRPRSGRGVIDVDEGAPPRRTFPSTDVVDVLSDAEEVVVIDDGDDDDDNDDDVSRYATAEGSSTNNEDLPEMPLLPLTSGVSVRGASSSSSSATSAWTSINPNHIRLLPQRVDRLWQPSLCFDASKSSTTPR